MTPPATVSVPADRVSSARSPPKASPPVPAVESPPVAAAWMTRSPAIFVPGVSPVLGAVKVRDTSPPVATPPSLLPFPPMASDLIVAVPVIVVVAAPKLAVVVPPVASPPTAPLPPIADESINALRT